MPRQQPIAVDESTQLIAPTMECLPGLTAIADEVSERWITPRQDGEVMQRWLARIIERNAHGRNARFCIHRASHCAGVVGFSSLDPIRISWWVGAPWRGTGLAESACRAVLGWLGTTRALTVVEATVHPLNAASLALAERLGFCDGGSVTKIDRRTGETVQHRRLVLRYGGWC
jgi:RimJ/RimL family protein N-acetyltransferase